MKFGVILLALQWKETLATGGDDALCTLHLAEPLLTNYPRLLVRQSLLQAVAHALSAMVSRLPLIQGLTAELWSVKFVLKFGNISALDPIQRFFCSSVFFSSSSALRPIRLGHAFPWPMVISQLQSPRSKGPHKLPFHDCAIAFLRP